MARDGTLNSGMGNGATSARSFWLEAILALKFWKVTVRLPSPGTDTNQYSGMAIDDSKGGKGVEC